MIFGWLLTPVKTSAEPSNGPYNGTDRPQFADDYPAAGWDNATGTFNKLNPNVIAIRYICTEADFLVLQEDKYYTVISAESVNTNNMPHPGDLLPPHRPASANIRIKEKTAALEPTKKDQLVDKMTKRNNLKKEKAEKISEKAISREDFAIEIIKQARALANIDPRAPINALKART